MLQNPGKCHYQDRKQQVNKNIEQVNIYLVISNLQHPAGESARKLGNLRVIQTDKIIAIENSICVMGEGDRGNAGDKKPSDTNHLKL